jgi:hypothetical protein
VEQRKIIIGDIHGCSDQLRALLKHVSFTPNDKLYTVGDLVDRGPDSVGTVELLRRLGALCTLGNHEHKYLELRQRGRDIPYKFNDDTWRWLEQRPLYYYLTPTLVVLHAGCLPYLPIAKQKVQTLLYLRHVQIGQERFDWEELWTGPESIIYGHKNRPDHRVCTSQNGIVTYGLDTGCCYGGRLTAGIFYDDRPPEFASVPVYQR